MRTKITYDSVFQELLRVVEVVQVSGSSYLLRYSPELRDAADAILTDQRSADSGYLHLRRHPSDDLGVGEWEIVLDA